MSDIGCKQKGSEASRVESRVSRLPCSAASEEILPHIKFEINKLDWPRVFSLSSWGKSGPASIDKTVLMFIYLY